MSGIIRLRGTDKIGFIEGYFGNGEYEISFENGEQGCFHKDEFEFVKHNPFQDNNKNVIQKLILALNNTKEWECCDIDNLSFIDFICKQSGINEETYNEIMHNYLEEELEDIEGSLVSLDEKVMAAAQETKGQNGKTMMEHQR